MIPFWRDVVQGKKQFPCCRNGEKALIHINTVFICFFYSCECPDGFEGPRCQQLRHSFNGTGYALYKQLEQCRNSRTSIEILTNKANGLILYNGPVEVLGQTDQTDFILLELVAGRPRLRINHGTGELALTIPGSKQLNDGTWHRIDIHRKSKVSTRPSCSKLKISLVNISFKCQTLISKICQYFC